MVARLISGCWAHTASANCSAVRWSSLRSRASITARRSTVILPPEIRIASIASSTRSVATLVSVAGGTVGGQVGRGGKGLSRTGQGCHDGVPMRTGYRRAGEILLLLLLLLLFFS